MEELSKLEAELAAMRKEEAELEKKSETQREKLRELERRRAVECFRLSALENLMKTSDDPFGEEFEEIRAKWLRLYEEITGPEGLAVSCNEAKRASNDCEYRLRLLSYRIQSTESDIAAIKRRGRS